MYTQNSAPKIFFHLFWALEIFHRFHFLPQFAFPLCFSIQSNKRSKTYSTTSSEKLFTSHFLLDLSQKHEMFLAKYLEKRLIWGVWVDEVEGWGKILGERVGNAALGAGGQTRQIFFQKEIGMDYPDSFFMSLWNPSSSSCLSSPILITFTRHLLLGQPTPSLISQDHKCRLHPSSTVCPECHLL